VKNFDESRHQRSIVPAADRTFVLCGEAFVTRASVRPDVLTAYDEINEATTITRTLEIVDEVIIAFLDKGANAVERYKKIRTNDEDPVTMSDLLDLVQWLIEVQTNRPTGPPVDSSSPPSPSGTSSTGGSSSKAIRAA
jgi:hypothetical protein